MGVLKLHVLNRLLTNNQYFCSELDNWLTDMRSKALPLTGSCARDRIRFFASMRDKINALKKRLNL
jgi:hypothetical protein